MPEWKPIPSYAPYEASSEGQIRNSNTGNVLNPWLVRGYPTVALWLDGQDKSRFVHRLVNLAFHPNPGGLRTTNHKDGDKTNNRPENLEWCSHADNMRHAVENGLTLQRGETHSRAILTRSQVIEIRASDRPREELAGKYGVRPRTIEAIQRRERWKHI